MNNPDQGRPDADEFVRRIVREMKIRFYQPKTVKSYRNELVALLRWFGAAPHMSRSLDIPPLEYWSEPLSWLTQAPRER